MSDNNEVILKSKEMYLLPVECKDYKLLYAPLADSILPVSESDVEDIANAIVHPQNVSPEINEMVNLLCEGLPVCEREGHVRDEADFVNLSILPNNICNFSCSYCYSAKGRSTQCLEFNKVKTLIDYFLSPERNTAPLLTVSILGGGEPLLSWKELVYPAILYMHRKASQLNRRLVITLITNGSVIPEDFVSICKDIGIDLVFSYEILREVQDVQRKHYELVTANITRLINEGIVPAINSVITELNVHRQEEMVDALHRNFPATRFLAFEPVIDGGINDRKLFYTRFMRYFIAARIKAKEYGIQLTCSVLRNVDVTVDRYCAGELAICADGTLSVCPCVSSPAEENYQKYIYGKVTENGVFIDSSKLKKLLAINVYKNEWCKDCFAKWNCGGGCMDTNINNDNRQDQDYCFFVRTFLIYILIERLDAAYREESGHSITEIIGDYGSFGTE